MHYRKKVKTSQDRVTVCLSLGSSHGAGTYAEDTMSSSPPTINAWSTNQSTSLINVSEFHSKFSNFIPGATASMRSFVEEPGTVGNSN
jgi:hypothetical protein